jgi:CheY-like chemotaxis protein
VHIPQKQPDRPLVLLVDDSAEHRDLYALMLEPTATVITASRGEDALAIARAEPLDAIVLDVLMPGMDGWAVAEHLKASPLTSSIPVILLTSLDGLEVPDRAHRVGAAAVIMKPCPVERLALAIQAAVQARQTGIVRGSAFSRTRRWTRKPVAISVPARIGAVPGHLVNVSYGGLCVEFDATPRGLVSPLEVTFPASRVAVSADVIWMCRGEANTLCGVEVAQVSPEWRGLVDAVG